MTDTAQAVYLLDGLGHDILQALLLPSLEVFILASVVWLLIRVYGEPAPRIRHMLWLLVIAKPLLSLVIPWQGPFALPVNPFTPVTTLTSAAPAMSVYTASWWLAHPYTVIFILWGLAVAAGIVWTAIGILRLFTHSRQTMSIPVPWVQALFARCQTTIGIRQTIALRMSDEFASPTLVWLGRPMVVVPSWCLIQLSPQELKQVFLHELLHYARRDHLALLLVQAARICFFFHPLVWIVGRRIGLEAERACDIAVVKVSQRPQSYASSLLKVAESGLRAPWRGVLELARSTSTAAQRIREVLAGFDNRVYALGPRAVIPLILCAVLSLTPLLHLPVQPVIYDLAGRGPVYTPLSLAQKQAAVRQNVAAANSGDNLVSIVSPTYTAPTPIDRSASGGERPAWGPAADQSPAWPARYGAGVRPGLSAPHHEPEIIPDRTHFDPASLGLPRTPLRQIAQTNRELRWKPGQIEVESVGQSSSKLGLPGMFSVRAGVFVTRTHELGGVFSVVESRDRFTDEQTRNNLEYNTVAPYIGTRPTSAMPATRITASDISDVNQTSETQQVDQVIRLGAFYRYNMTDVSEAVVPFVSVGAGVEVRPGRDPVLVDGGAGVRLFVARRAAVVVRLDYMKEIELTPRSHISASLGFSTIF